MRDLHCADGAHELVITVWHNDEGFGTAAKACEDSFEFTEREVDVIHDAVVDAFVRGTAKKAGMAPERIEALIAEAQS